MIFERDYGGINDLAVFPNKRITCNYKVIAALKKKPSDAIRKWSRRIKIVFSAEDKPLSVPNVNITLVASLANHNLFQVTIKLTVICFH